MVDHITPKVVFYRMPRGHVNVVYTRYVEHFSKHLPLLQTRCVGLDD